MSFRPLLAPLAFSLLSASPQLAIASEDPAPAADPLESERLMEELWLHIDEDDVDAAVAVCRSLLASTPEGADHGALRERALILTVNAVLRAVENAAEKSKKAELTRQARELIQRYFEEFVKTYGHRPPETSTAFVYSERLDSIDVDDNATPEAAEPTPSEAPSETEAEPAATTQADAAPPPTAPTPRVVQTDASAPGTLRAQADDPKKSKRLALSLLIPGAGLVATSAVFWTTGGVKYLRWRDEHQNEGKNDEYRREQAPHVALAFSTAALGVGMATWGTIVLLKARNNDRAHARRRLRAAPMFSRNFVGSMVGGRF